jgi:hypothetical protein
MGAHGAVLKGFIGFYAMGNNGILRKSKIMAKQPHRAFRGSAFAPAASRLLRTPPIPCAGKAGEVYGTFTPAPASEPLARATPKREMAKQREHTPRAVTRHSGQ